MHNISRYSIFLTAVLSAGIPAFAAEPPENPASPALSADRAFGQARISGDLKKIGKALDDRLIWVDRTGKIGAKKQYLSDMPKADAGDRDSDVQARRYGTMAIVTGNHHSATLNLDTRFLHVYAERSGVWKAIALDETTIKIPDANPKPVAAPVPAPKAVPGATCENPCRDIPYSPAGKVEKELVETYEKLEIASTFADIDAYAATLADELTIIPANFIGNSVTKPAAIANHTKMKEAGVYYATAPVTQSKILVSGDAAVLESLHVFAVGAPKPTVSLQVWVKRDGRWQLAISQQTRVEESDGAAK